MSKEQVSTEYLKEDISGQLIAAASIILIATTVLLALRLYVRSLLDAKSGLEDFLLVPAYLLSVGACITGLLAATLYGAGRHIEAVMLEDPSSIVFRSALLYCLSWLTVYSNCFSRVSILALLFKISTPGVTRIGTALLIIYMVLYAISQSIALALECRPLAKIWHFELNGTCIDLYLFFKMSGILNIAGDVAIMILPVHMVWNLHVSTAERIRIAFVFLSGSIGLIASCFRTSLFFNSQDEATEDPTWGNVKLISWTIVETGMYTSASCMMRLRPLLRKLRGWYNQARSGHGSNGTGNASGNTRESKGYELKHYANQGRIPLTSFDQDLA